MKFWDHVGLCMKKQHKQKSSLFDILICSKNCISYTENMSFEQFENDDKTYHAVQH